MVSVLLRMAGQVTLILWLDLGFDGFFRSFFPLHYGVADAILMDLRIVSIVCYEIWIDG